MSIAKWFSACDLKQKVRYLLMLSIGVSVLFCTVMFLFILINNMSEYALKKGQDNLNSISQNIEKELDHVNNISKLIMSNETVSSYLKGKGTGRASSKNVGDSIYKILNSFSGQYSVFVFHLDQRYVNTGIGVVSVDKEVIFGEKWKRRIEAQAGGYLLIPNEEGAFQSNVNDKFISFARTINDLDTQKEIGILVINIPIKVFEDSYQNLLDSNNSFAYLNEKGDIICNTPGFEMNQMMEMKEKQVTQSIQKRFLQESVWSVTTIKNSQMILAGNTKVRIVEGLSREILWSLLGVTVLTGITLLFANKYISKYITTPIQKLVASMAEVKKGWLHRVSISTNKDEIGSLRDNYNEMLIEINRLINEVVEKERIRQEAELEILQEQIKPHFLYNTLDTIAYMALANEPGEVYDAIETLGNFYRKFLSKGNKYISLYDEIEIVKNYLKLQKLRYIDVFEDEYNIAEGLGHIQVPRLILQPLVENAIYHGVRLKGEKGLIRITVFVKAANVHILIYDTGVGMSQERIQKLLSGEDSRSFGLKGTIERIKHSYEKDDVIEIRSQEGKYCEIEIKIPSNEVLGYV